MLRAGKLFPSCYQGSLVAAPFFHAKGKGAMSVPIFLQFLILGQGISASTNPL